MGRPSRYTREMLANAVLESESYSGVLRLLGASQVGGMHSYITKRINEFSIDTSHFTGKSYNRGKVAQNRRSAAEILVFKEDLPRREHAFRLVRALKEVGVAYRCEKCGCDGEWLGQAIALHVDHKNGDWRDNRAHNLRFLCPNCHSQTHNFGSKKNKIASVAERQTLGA